MVEKEEWRVYYENNLPKTNRRYVKWEVSSEGNVKRNGELYKPKTHEGYFFVGCGFVHRMVAEMFIPNPDNKPCIDHINGNRQDNRVCNLRWCTHKENSNNPITIKRISESRKGRKLGPPPEETRKRLSELNKEYYKTHDSSTKGKHRVYHEDGTYHYE